MAQVIVGMSGGVDSAVAAWLLKQTGFEVVGVTLRTWSSRAYSRCCEIDDARATARLLDIPFHVYNCERTFRTKVLEPFADYYLHGLTPNPCVSCNRSVKWEWLLYLADVLGADYVATGHFARVIRLENGRYAIGRGKDEKKDQSYMLWQLTQEQLARTLLPLGERTKAEVRNLALQAGLPVAKKADSQEICFVTEGSYGEYLEREMGRDLPGPGDFVDETGTVLGTHRGIVRYTVGQRRGLGLSLGHPVYVNRINAKENQVIVGDESQLYRTSLLCRHLNFMGLPGLETSEARQARVKIRYHHAGEDAEVQSLGEDLVRVCFAHPVRAPAPGQSAVFYDRNGRILGGGEITEDPTERLQLSRDNS